MGDVLSAPLGALETQLARNGWIVPRRGAASASESRLREVLDRDRALIAAQPALAPAVPAPVPTSTSTPVPVAGDADNLPALEPEPIRTRTMARLLAAQGYRERALAMYRTLLAASPSDAELQHELERLIAATG